MLQALATTCLSDVPGSSRSFRLETPPTHPYLRSALVSDWLASNYRIFTTDSTAASSETAQPLLSYSIEEIQVAYKRLKKKQIRRTLSLTTHYTFTELDGEVREDVFCTERAEDTIASSALGAIESERYPETKAIHPPTRWSERYLEPVILASASIIGVYLFFTLRSDSDSDDN